MTKVPPKTKQSVARVIEALDPNKPVLIAGPTASGKSDLALAIAEQQGGSIINADASQVYRCWRVLTARPSIEDEARAPHHLYGHKEAHDLYSVGHWVRDVTPLLSAPIRPIIVGGTGLNFNALLNGLAEIPTISSAVRDEADAMSLEDLSTGIDAETAASIDMNNRARVQRAWEVQKQTGRGLTEWHRLANAKPLLSMTSVQAIAFDVSRDWLNARIERRFDQMLEKGALDEAKAILPDYDPSLPAHRAIGARELIAYLKDEMTLEEARMRATIATRQYAKRQRTWIRNKMQEWVRYIPPM